VHENFNKHLKISQHPSVTNPKRFFGHTYMLSYILALLFPHRTCVLQEGWVLLLAHSAEDHRMTKWFGLEGILKIT